MNDTSPEISALVRERLLARSGAERVLMGSRMFDVARAMVLASFPSGLSELEIRVVYANAFTATRWMFKPSSNTSDHHNKGCWEYDPA